MFGSRNVKSILITPVNALANIASMPVFTALEPVTITGFSFVASAAITGANADYVLIKLIQLANVSNVVATLNVNTGVNVTANARQNCTVNTTIDEVSSGMRLGLSVACNDTGNVNLGSETTFQLDYVQGSPAALGH